MVGWHHLLSGQLAQFEQVPGVGDGQGSLVCCSPWGRKQTQLSDSTELIQFSWVFNTLCGPGVSCSGSRAFVSIISVASEISNQGNGLPDAEKLVMTNGEGSS